MVYCGKPSKACLECRVKRRKCDLSKPSCRQCTRALSKCSGYRDQIALSFRDQSLDVVRRARGTTSNSGRPESKELPSTATKPPRKAVSHYVEKIPQYFPYSWVQFSFEDQAVPFFFHHYLSVGQNECLSIMGAQGSMNGYLSSIVDAVGMASLSNLKKVPSLKDTASQKYTSALQQIRAGLAEPTQVISDQMMVAVMLLTLYETVACNGAYNISSQGAHIDGALTLLQLRGIQQLNSKIGRKLFMQLRTDVVISCLQRKEAAPHVMIKWMSEAQKFETTEEKPANDLAIIIVKACSFLASIKTLHNPGVLDVVELSLLISEATSIDADLAGWSRVIPPTYKYTTTITTTECEDSFAGRFHSYTDSSIANTWNLYRCARIILHQTVNAITPPCHQLLSTESSLSSYIHSAGISTAVIQEAASGICLSGSFIFGCFRKGQSEPYELRAACGVPLLWPIYIAGTSCNSTDPLRQWAISQLDKIGDSTGIQRAKVIAQKVREA